MADQLSFKLPKRTAMGRDDFFVSDANAQAVATLGPAGVWPDRKLILLGPLGCGKSHLANIWRSDKNAVLFNPTRPFRLPGIGAFVLVEDVDEFAGDHEQESNLFHLHNFLMANQGTLLATTTKPVIQCGFQVPDLLSRLCATATVKIDPPDDALLQAVVVKHFMDRQLAPSPSVQKYLLQNMDRSFAAAAQIVADLDAMALAKGSPINRAIVAQVLGL